MRCIDLNRRITRLMLLCLAVFFHACSTAPVSLPPISAESSGSHDTGRVIWHDLLVKDVETSKRFYGELFGWQFKSLPIYEGASEPGSYTLILNQGRPIGGMVDTTGLRKDVNLSQWVSLFSTADINASTAMIKKAGGTLYTPATSVGERGHIAVAADPQGALFALLQTANGDPAEQSPLPGDFLWNELWTQNLNDSAGFYQRLFAYQKQALPLDHKQTYHYFSKADKARAAIIDNPVPGLKPTWVTFIRVSDPAEIVSKVEGLGGEVLLDVQKNPVGGELAIIRDPEGAGFVIQTWQQAEGN